MVGVQKRKIRWAISLFLVMLYFSCLPVHPSQQSCYGELTQAQYGGGSGEPNDPYLIYTAEQMNEIGLNEEDWDKHFKLMADIDLSEYDGKDGRLKFNIIGRYFGWGHPDTKAFSGVFDGNGKVIRNFTWSSVDRDTVALFAFLDWNATGPTIKNLGLEEVNIRAENGCEVAALAAQSEGEIANCYVTGHVSGWREVGGLVADAADGDVVDCYSLAIVEGDQAVGGLVGNTDTEDANIRRCYSCSIVAGNDSVGGLVGNLNGSLRYSFSNSTVTGDSRVGGLVGAKRYESRTVDCYARGSVTGNNRVGGLVGSNGGSIAKCYSTGSVSGNEDVGGLVGCDYDAKVSTSFWDIETSGQITSAGGMGKTTAEMQTDSTFLNAGWDFVDETENGTEDIWKISDGLDYPRLWWEKYGGGTGEPNDPYLIYTAEQMNAIGADANDWDKYFKLMADIDLSAYTGTDFNIIGFCWTHPFTGVFDGNGHTISNFSYTSTDTGYVGLFRCVGTWEKDALIKDLGLIDPNVDAGIGSYVGSLVGLVIDGTINNCYVQGGSVTTGDDEYVGGLVGALNRGTITNCYSTVSVSGGDDSVGGLVGHNEGTIINCYASGSVTGTEDVGGLVGDDNGTITNCYATGSVTGQGYVGGLVGDLNGGTITNCYSSSNVSGDERVGGLVGYNHHGTITNCTSSGSVLGADNVGGLVGINGSTITNCYSVGSVTGTTHVGGLIGREYGTSTVTDSFWDIETSVQATSAGGTGKTTAEMQTESTFTDAGWDFVGESVSGTEDIWSICEGTNYPRLVWQIPAGDFICPDGITIEDFVFFIEHWRDDNCDLSNDYCQGTDLDFSGTVDEADLEILVDNWLVVGND